MDMTSFVQAAADGNIPIVRAALQQGIPIDSRNEKGDTALIAAAAGGQSDSLKLLLEQGAVANIKSLACGSTALMKAAEGGHFLCLQLLLKNAAGRDVLRQLVHDTNNNGDTALMLAAAATQANKLCVMALLIKGAASTLNMRNTNGDTALMIALKNRNSSCAELLQNAVRHEVSGAHSDNLLLAAAGQGDVQGMRDALAVGFGLEEASSIGDTALILAATAGHVESVKFLLDHGANVNASNQYGDTALIRAASLGHISCFPLLVDNGANINAADNDGWTAVMYSAKGDYAECFTYLLNAGADLNLKSVDNMVVWDVATGKCAEHLPANLSWIITTSTSVCYSWVSRYIAELISRPIPKPNWKTMRSKLPPLLLVGALVSFCLHILSGDSEWLLEDSRSLFSQFKGVLGFIGQIISNIRALEDGQSLTSRLVTVAELVWLLSIHFLVLIVQSQVFILRLDLALLLFLPNMIIIR